MLTVLTARGAGLVPCVDARMPTELTVRGAGLVSCGLSMSTRVLELAMLSARTGWCSNMSITLLPGWGEGVGVFLRRSEVVDAPYLARAASTISAFRFTLSAIDWAFAAALLVLCSSSCGSLILVVQSSCLS